jgi:hypothetical protein
MTPEEAAELGPGAMSLLIDIMQKNENETATIRQSLIDAIQHEREDAWATVSRIRHNISIILGKPHTDSMVMDALYMEQLIPFDGGQ